MQGMLVSRSAGRIALLAAKVAVDGDQLVMPTLSVLHFVPV